MREFLELLSGTMMGLGFRGRLMGPYKIHYTRDGISVRYEGKYVPELTLHYKNKKYEFDDISELLEHHLIKQEIRKQKLQKIKQL